MVIRAKVKIRPAQTQKQSAENRDDGPTEKFQQTNQGFWISRAKNELRIRVQAKGERPALEKKRKKTLGIISIFPLQASLAAAVKTGGGNATHITESVTHG
jgi:hypothetical protein